MGTSSNINPLSLLNLPTDLLSPDSKEVALEYRYSSGSVIKDTTKTSPEK